MHEDENALVTDQYFAEEAARIAGEEGGAVMRLSTLGGRFHLGELDLGAKVSVIPVAWRPANMYYEDDFTPGQNVPPVCYAVGPSRAELKPSPDVPKPQHPTCHGCPQGAWGSGKGNSKACRNMARVFGVLISDEVSINHQPVIVSVPPTGLRSWTSFITRLLMSRIHLHNVSVAVTLTTGKKGGFSMAFTQVAGKVTEVDAQAVETVRDYAASIVERAPVFAHAEDESPDIRQAASVHEKPKGRGHRGR